nr:MAG TPA: hypothetical protein [Caudoviricetes sp.]
MFLAITISTPTAISSFVLYISPKLVHVCKPTTPASFPVLHMFLCHLQF